MTCQLENGKRCSKCKELKPVQMFSKKSKAADGLQSRCKECIHEDSVRYYWANREKLQEKYRQRYKVNPDYFKRRAQLWAEANPERVREISRWQRYRWRKTHGDQVRARDRAHYAANREKLRERARRWRAKHPEVVRAQNARWAAAYPDKRRDINARRRARKRKAQVEIFSRADIFERDSGHCHICGKKADSRNWHLDHLIPLSLGGQHTKRNVAVAHPSCNMRKYNTGPTQLRLFG